MKTTHQLAFFSSLLVPIGAILGVGAGRALGALAPAVAVGIALGFVAAWFLQRSAAANEDR